MNIKSLARSTGHKARTRAQSRQEITCGKETRKAQKSSHVLKPELEKERDEFVAINTYTSRNKWFYWQVSNCMKS